MRYTLLELVQDILSSMDSDEVNSINDTVESSQVVKVIKTVYDDAVGRLDLHINKTPFNLDASGDNTKPVLMTKPSNIDVIHWVRYNKIEDGDTDPNWQDIRYLPFLDFIDYSQRFSLDETNVDSMTHSADGYTFSFHYRTDIGPNCYTSFNDGTLIFDAYDSTVDDTLQSSKTLCYGTKETPWTESDSFVLDLQPEQFALILNEAKALAWAELKQQPHQKAERTSRRNWVSIQRRRQQVPDGRDVKDGSHHFHKLPNFGR